MSKSTVKFVGILAIAAALISSPVHAQTTTPAAQRVITVVGIGKASAIPNIARVTLGVDIVNARLNTALSEVNKKTSDVIAALKKAGIDDKDIRTLEFNVFPQQAYGPNGPGPITGYRVANNVRVTIRDLSKVGPVLDAAVTAGANTINNLAFSLDDDSPMQSEARTNAVKDAKFKADTLAKEAGATVGNVISISEVVGAGAVPMPMMQNAASGVGAGGGGVEIAPGLQDISVQVQVTFEIE
jgi:uncharacterized protein YggE